MGYREVNIDQLIWDLNARVNADLEGLERSIAKFGLLSPLVVEGPNPENRYYIIDGYRRYLILKNRNSKEITVGVNVIGEPTSKLQREMKRFHIQNTSKKIIGAEEQFAIEEIQREGSYTDEEMVSLLDPKKNRQRRIQISRKIDENVRREVAKVRGSQHALEVIYSLDISELERSRLYRLLTKRQLTGEHADALKRLNSHELFERLDSDQKTLVINQAIRQAKFTKNEAELILLMEIMKSEPELEKAYIHEWINYMCGVLEELNESFNVNIKNHTSEFQKNRIKNTLSTLNSRLDWVWGKQYKENKNEERPKEEQYDFNAEKTDKGFRFRKHKF